MLRMNYEVYPSRLLYNPCELNNNFNDSMRRVKYDKKYEIFLINFPIRWASKLAVDVSFIMEHASSLGRYYLHLEDDTPLIPTTYQELDRSVRLLEEFGVSTNATDTNAKIAIGGMYAHAAERHPEGFFMLRLCNERLVKDPSYLIPSFYLLIF